jgi:hypothetical protein
MVMDLKLLELQRLFLRSLRGIRNFERRDDYKDVTTRGDRHHENTIDNK